MRSFALSAFATLAFGLFCSAAPTPIEADIAVAVGSLLDIDVAAAVELNNGVLRRDTEVPTEDTECLEGVLTYVVGAVDSIVEKITSLETGVTVDILSSHLGEVEDIFNTAIKLVEELDIEVCLKSITTGDLLDVADVADLIASLLRVVMNLLKCVLGLVTGAVKEEVLPLLLKIVDLLCKLLSLVLDLVGHLLSGVIAAVLERITDLIPFIIECDLKSLIGLLGIVH